MSLLKKKRNLLELAIAGGNQKIVKMILFGKQKLWPSNRTMRNKSIVLAIGYERWSIILMLINEWKKELFESCGFGTQFVLARNVWEELKETLKTVKSRLGEETNVLEELKSIVDSVVF